MKRFGYVELIVNDITYFWSDLAKAVHVSFCKVENEISNGVNYRFRRTKK